MYHNKCDFRNETGRRIALMRHLREMTQKEVAFKVGKSVGYVRSVESGKLNPVNLKAFSEVLGVNEKYLKEGGNISIEMA